MKIPYFIWKMKYIGKIINKKRVIIYPIFHFPSGIWQPHVIYLEESSNKKRFRLHLIKENVGKIQNGLQIVVQR
jgi:hypothetical protein